MKLMVVGASRGPGRAFVEGLGSTGDTVIGFSHRRPDGLTLPAGVHLAWIEADALRESFREQRLAVTCLQLGYLNTDDGLEVPPEAAARRGEGRQIPLHDVIRIVSALLQLSPASFVRELVLPTIGDERF